MKKEDIRIVARVTKKEKERINSIAERCGLLLSAVVRVGQGRYPPFVAQGAQRSVQGARRQMYPPI